MNQSGAGKLFLISTPIGNLNDISRRALDTLNEVDLIAAEDTRHAGVLLKHYGIDTPTTSYFDYNKEKKTPFLIEKLKKGENVGLITDAGTPGISDPAFYLVREAIRNEIPVEAIPGPAAFLVALVISGLPTDRFVFEGFLPAKKGRQTRLKELAAEKRTIILYESPHRIQKTLSQLYETLGNRPICICRELTKKFETVYRGRLEQFVRDSQLIKAKGEFVLVIAGMNYQ